MNGFFWCIYILNFNFKIKFKEIFKFMFNTHVIYYFYVDRYKISSNDT
jgi:hypothetical protein